MSRKIFTKYFVTPPGDIAHGVTTVENAAWSWLMQEDIEVIGAQMATEFTEMPANDGYCLSHAELSQTGIIGREGAILEAIAYAWWNTTPAGIALVAQTLSVVFPAGFTVPVKEEGYLYVNRNLNGAQLSAGTAQVMSYGQIWYVKKGH